MLAQSLKMLRVASSKIVPSGRLLMLGTRSLSCSRASNSKEYAYEMLTTNLRFGPGVTRELGMDVANMGGSKVGLFTDKYVRSLSAFEAAIDSLRCNKIDFEVFDQVAIEPNDSSLMRATSFAQSSDFDVLVAVGGGSVMDSCKVANLLSTSSSSSLLDYVNLPIGRAKAIEKSSLKPMIAVPTTAGTASETTGIAVFDYEPLKAKTGIAHRSLKPTLGLVDPLHTLTVPSTIAAYTGLDVLCHALESLTAIPYLERSPCPSNPSLRPSYQGSNPISDVWVAHTLSLIKENLVQAVNNPQDLRARSNMHLASSIAGPAAPDRHLEGARLLGRDVRGAKAEDAGSILSDVLLDIMEKLAVPDGLKELHFDMDDVPKLVASALPQERLNKLAPRPQSPEDLAKLFEDSMRIY